MEFAMHMDPCMLCMGQRFIYVGIAFVSLLAILHNPMFGGHQRYGFGLLLLSLSGVGLASRQLYLQALPEEQVPACGPSFSYMLETFPLMEVLTAMVQGSGSCATIQWSFLSLSIAGWSLVMFTFLGLNGLRLTIIRPSNLLP
jgi:disulfide bond formation protein DsbB